MATPTLEAREGTASFRSGVGFLRLSYPCLVCILFSAPSQLEMKFVQKLFSPSKEVLDTHYRRNALPVERLVESQHDDYTVAVMKKGDIVGGWCLLCK